METPRGAFFGVAVKKYIDAHCHLFDEKLPNNIGAIVNATRPADWGDVIAGADKNPSVFAAIGVHPWFVGDLVAGWDAQLCELLEQHPGLMIGEIGLDKHKPDMDTQINVFARQMDLAVELGRGVHVHCVGAWDKMFAVLKRYKSQQPPFILFHRFSGNAGDVARLVVDYNAYFSFSGVGRVIVDVPQDRILVETDSNHPMGIVRVAEQIAAIYPDCDFHENTMGMLKNG